MRMEFLSLLLWLAFAFRCANATINIKFEDVNVEYFNPEYLDEGTFELSVNYVNETYNTLRCRMIVIKDFPRDLTVSVKIYGYAFGSYRIPLAFDVNSSTCDLKSKKIFIAGFIRAMGGDLDKCVPDKGEYRNDSFYPVDYSVLPSFFPRNKYRMEVEIKNAKLTIVKGQVFIEIS